MRILIVTGVFGGENLDPWLLDDLARALADMGDDVDVLVCDTKSARPAGYIPYSDKRIRLFSAGPTRIYHGAIGRIVTHLSAGWRLHTIGYRLVRRRRYDLVVSNSIGLLSWGLPARLRRAGIAQRSLFLLWDFFPIHHIEIGRIRARLVAQPLRILEGLSMKSADVIAVMSPANEQFLRAYHPRINSPTVIVPPWASTPPPSPNGATVRPRFTALFGGQLTAGRGLDTLLRAARLVQDRQIPMDLLIVGDGPAYGELVSLSRKLGLSNTKFIKRLPRDAYRALIRSIDVGVAITVPGVSPPTFPSKISEYCACGVPVVVCVEPSSDAGQMVVQAGAGLSTAAGDAAGLADALATLQREHAGGILEARAQNALVLFQNTLSAAKAAATIRGAGPTSL